MILEKMLRELTIGTIIRSEVPKGKRTYISHKDRNGEEEQILTFKTSNEVVEWFVIGISLKGGKECIKCVEKEPNLSLKLRGGPACFYAEKELNNISRYFFRGNGIAHVRSINASDVNSLLGVEIQPSNRYYTFGKGDYAPRNFVKHRRANQGDRIRNSAYCYNEAELLQSPAKEIVFIDKPYWLASMNVSIENGFAYFGVGKVTEDGSIDMKQSLFRTTGVSGSDTSYVRSVIYIDLEFFSLEKLNDGVFNLVAS